VDLHPLPVHGRSASSAYIHLVDGGLADNTGVRAAIETVAARGGIARTTRLAGFRGVKVRVFIVVNAQVDPRDANDDSPNTPGLLRQLRSVIDVPIDRYSASSLQALGDAVQQWQTDLRFASVSHEDEEAITRAARIHLIEIGVASAQDPIAAEVVRNIPTSLRIDAQQVETIRRFVRNEFAANPAWQQLLGHLRSQESTLKSASARDSVGSDGP
jgi:NTE family protein